MLSSGLLGPDIKYMYSMRTKSYIYKHIFFKSQTSANYSSNYKKTKIILSLYFLTHVKSGQKKIMFMFNFWGNFTSHSFYKIKEIIVLSKHH